MILKDRFLTQSAPDICHKLQKQVFWPNQSLEKVLQLAQMVYYGREYKEQNKRLKRTRQKTEPPTMAVRSALKRPEKNAQRNPGAKGWTCYYRGKEGHLKWDCLQASKPPLAPCPVCKGPHWRRDCPPRCRPLRSDSQGNLYWRCLGVPTQAPFLIIPGETQILITVGGSISQFLLDTGATFSVLAEAPGLPSSWSTTVMGLSDEPNIIMSVIL